MLQLKVQPYLKLHVTTNPDEGGKRLEEGVKLGKYFDLHAEDTMLHVQLEFPS